MERRQTGRACGLGNEGSVFELVPPPIPGDLWTENILHSFDTSTSDGFRPVARVVFDNAGNLYGTTQYGGGHGDCDSTNVGGCGTVFKLAPPTSEGGDWTETIVHSFDTTTTDGDVPSGGLLRWKNGVLFGVTFEGGRFQEGTVYGIVP
jgi:hypothetical protein